MAKPAWPPPTTITSWRLVTSRIYDSRCCDVPPGTTVPGSTRAPACRRHLPADRAIGAIEDSGEIPRPFLRPARLGQPGAWRADSPICGGDRSRTSPQDAALVERLP